MMVFLAVLLIFSCKTSKVRYSVTKKRQLLGDVVPQTPSRGFVPAATGGLPSPRPPGPPPFAHYKYATDCEHDL